MKSNFEAAKVFFLDAEEYVSNNFPEDLVWSKQVKDLKARRLTQQILLGEYAYVVYCSGFKQKVVEKYWQDLNIAYYNFVSELIEDKAEEVRGRALQYIRHERKVDAIIETAKWLRDMTFDEWQKYKRKITPDDKFQILTELKYIGGITKYHLARNIGFDTIKPDRHLDRIAASFGMDPFEMCRKLSEISGVFLGKHYAMHSIDTIFWRTAAENMVVYDPYARLKYESGKIN